MYLVLAQAGVLILAGLLWRRLAPQGLDGDTTRRVVTAVVYYLLLPALVLGVIWRAEVGHNSLALMGAAAAGVISALGLSLWWYRHDTDDKAVGAMVLAAAFANVTYLGLPVLEKTFGPWARGVALQYDFLVNTPLLFTVGIMAAQHYGQHRKPSWEGLTQLRHVPALWAAVVALAFNAGGVPLPAAVEDFLETLGRAVPPLMLFALGLSLQWRGGRRGQWRLVAPALIIQLLIMPAVVAAVGYYLHLPRETWLATSLEAAMPTMVLGIALCDRYGLDTSLFATTVTLSTILSAVTLPLWFNGLQMLVTP